MSVTGIGLYAGRGRYSDVNVKLIMGQSSYDTEILADITDEIEGDDERVHQVPFGEAITIEPKTWYTISTTMSGYDCCRGDEGEASITADSGITFSFKQTSGNNNGCNVGAGQIPAIYYTVGSSKSVRSAEDLLPTAWSTDSCRNVSLEEGDCLAISSSDGDTRHMSMAVANAPIPTTVDDYYFEATLPWHTHTHVLTHTCTVVCV